MCNCGKKRTILNHQPAFVNRNIPNLTQQPVMQKEPVLFQYTGNTALTITGSVTRKNYRFNFPGNIIAIDSNDASAMMAVPVLKKV